MNHSDSIVNLAAAIVKAQAEISAVMENKQNPFLKSTYADLGAVIEAIRTPFEKHGISVVQFPFGENGEIGVETILLHSSGEWLSERVSMSASEEKGKTDAQVAGSIISYLRRYGISSVARIYTEDNDGQTVRGSREQERTQARNSMPEDSGKKIEEKSSYARAHPPLSPVQRGKMVELYQALHEGNDTDATNGIEKLFQDTFKHGLDKATYEEGARLTGQLLSELRNQTFKESTEKHVDAPANSDKGTKENSQITPTAKPKKIETATCPVHLTTTILWESNGIKKWYHKTEDGQECYAIPEKAKGA